MKNSHEVILVNVYKVKRARSNIYDRGLIFKNLNNKSGYSLNRHKPADGNDFIIVEEGQPYYWWQFKNSGKIISKTYPKPEQLISSRFVRECLYINDQINNLTEDAPGFIKKTVDRLEAILDDYETKILSMPTNLKCGVGGTIMRLRCESISTFIYDLENSDMTIEAIKKLKL